MTRADRPASRTSDQLICSRRPGRGCRSASPSSTSNSGLKAYPNKGASGSDSREFRPADRHRAGLDRPAAEGVTTKWNAGRACKSCVTLEDPGGRQSEQLGGRQCLLGCERPEPYGGRWGTIQMNLVRHSASIIDLGWSGDSDGERQPHQLPRRPTSVVPDQKSKSFTAPDDIVRGSRRRVPPYSVELDGGHQPVPGRRWILLVHAASDV